MSHDNLRVLPARGCAARTSTTTWLGSSVPQTICELERWGRLLYEINGEIEQFYGPPGDNNPAAIDAAVQTASYTATCELRRLRELEEAQSVAP